MHDETWAARGVEIDNHQWRELIKPLEMIAELMPGDYTQFLLVALHACIVRGDAPKEAKANAHEIACMMTIDDD